MVLNINFVSGLHLEALEGVLSLGDYDVVLRHSEFLLFKFLMIN